MISVKSKGSLKKTNHFLEKSVDTGSAMKVLEYYAQKGVKALAEATPSETGKTAASWGYELEKGKGYYSIHWTNSNVVNGTKVALILQMGHATKSGGWVEGVDYINPALQPIFNEMAISAWKEITA